jgi:hypothetical protein
MEYMQSKFTRFSPADVTDKGSKIVKRPVIKGWLDVTEEQSAELARHPDYRDGHFMFLTGKANNIIVIDIDRFNPSRPDHEGMKDGLKKWDELFPDLDYTNSLIVLTPSGGRHLYCEYDETINSKEIAKDVLIDILSDGSAFIFGPMYQILRSPERVPPIHQEVKMYLTMNNYGTITNNYNICAPKPIQDWDIKEIDKNCFQLIAKSGLCCVDNSHVHSEPGHSCVYVRKTSVIANCFRHGKRIITGAESRYLRESFFDFK